MNLKRSLSKRFRSVRALVWKPFDYVNLKPDTMTTEAANTDRANLSFEIPIANLQKSRSRRNILFVMPFFGPDATSVNVESLIAAFKRLGFTVHVLIYNDSGIHGKTENWDCVHFIRSQTGSFGRTKADGFHPNESYDLIDDWAGDELVMYVAALVALIDFEICVCNYVFLSRCLEFLPETTLKIIFTHDVFAHRNAKIVEATGNPSGQYFSTNNVEEKKGLLRADLVLAVQDEEASYFKELLGHERVGVLPYVPPCRFQPLRQDGLAGVVGFIASGHAPNITAIREFIAEFRPEGGATLKVAGSICSSLDPDEFPVYIKLAGRVDDLDAFYESCDVIINPDMLRSGLKIKCVEALSYGKPLVCTAAAAVGLRSAAPFHNLGSVRDVARVAEKCMMDKTFLATVRAESIRLYTRFASAHNTYVAAAAYEKLAEEKRDLVRPDALRRDADANLPADRHP